MFLNRLSHDTFQVRPRFISWRYAEVGEAIYDSSSNRVRDAPNSPAINMAECDKGLHERAGGAAAVAVAGQGVRRDDGPLAAAAAGVDSGGAINDTALLQGPEV